MFGSVGGRQGIGAPISERIGGENFIRHIGNDKLICDFHEGSGTTVHDKSHNNNDGTFGAGAAAPTWRRNSLYFNGGDYINILDDPTLNFGANTDFTLEAVIKTSTKVAYQYFIAKGDVGGTALYYIARVNITTGILLAALNDSVAEKGISGTTDISDGNWYHYIATANRSGDLTHYINEKQEGTPVDISGMATIDETGNLRISGRESDSVWGFLFTGYMSNIRIIAKALSQIEVQQEYLANKFRGNN